MDSDFKMFIALAGSDADKQLDAFPLRSRVYVVVDPEKGEDIIEVLDPATWPELSKTLKFKTFGSVG